MRTERRPPPPPWLIWVAILVGFATIVGWLLFWYRYLEDLTRGHPGTFGSRFTEQFTGSFSAAALIPLIVWTARRFRLDRAGWASRVPVHLATAIVLSLLKTTMQWGSRSAIFPLAGLGAYDYGIMHIRYLMEMPNDLIWYALVVGAVYLIDYYAAAKEHAVRAARLEARLAQAQLQNLRLQLQPHFLFNALNTISSAMYEDPRRADVMIGRLGELLRHTLRAPRTPETTLDDELRALDLYLDIMRARFEERLTVRVAASPEDGRALVPQLILQPLVENAIRHGYDDRAGRGVVDVRCQRENGTLLLEIRDHGPGLRVDPADAMQAAGGGIGLANTAARLRQLYGDAHRLTFENAADGGLRVRISIPYHVAEPVPAA